MVRPLPAPISGPGSPRGAAGQRRQGAAPHFGLEGPEKQKGREMVGAGQRSLSGSLHGLLPSQAAWGWLAKAPDRDPKAGL